MMARNYQHIPRPLGPNSLLRAYKSNKIEIVIQASSQIADFLLISPATIFAATTHNNELIGRIVRKIELPDSGAMTNIKTMAPRIRPRTVLARPRKRAYTIILLYLPETHVNRHTLGSCRRRILVTDKIVIP